MEKFKDIATKAGKCAMEVAKVVSAVAGAALVVLALVATAKPE